MKREDFLVEIEGDIDSTDLTPKHKRPSGDKIALVKFDGTAITTNGNLVKHNWFKGLQLNQAKYTDIMLTAEEAQQLHAGQTQMKIGASSATPLLCYGEACPMAAKCHPEGTMIRTTNHGEIAIEDLDPEIHELVSFRRHSSVILGVKKGYKFKKFKRNYHNFMIHLESTSGKNHSCTPDHISLIRWDPSALDKFCVYLMQKGDFFRVGKTKLLRYENSRKGLRFGPSSRAIAEKADKLWILGVTERNSEALLMEEFFSCILGIPKALFLEAQEVRKKQDGLYAWVTQNELNNHHESLKQSPTEIKRKLERLGLLYEYPIWAKDSIFDSYCDQRLGTAKLLEMRSCNIISDYMQVLTYDQEQKWEKVKKVLTPFNGVVWSLDVDKYHTYIANKIVTHNCHFMALQREIDARKEERNVVPIGRICPIEQDLLFEWVSRYAEEFGVTDAPGNFTDQRLILELAECEVLEHRMNVVLSTKYQDLTEDKIVAVMQDEYGEREQHVKDVADAVRIREKLEIKKDKIHKKLVATRFDQYKREAALQETGRTDNANLQAELTARLKKLEDLTKDR